MVDKKNNCNTNIEGLTNIAGATIDSKANIDCNTSTMAVFEVICNTSNPGLTNNGAIEVKNLTARYGSNVVFENISFSLSAGSFTALCGPNGAGKSTLLSLMDGIIPDGLKVTGEILVNGKNVFKQKRNVIAKNISYLVQKETPVWNMKVSDFIETGLYAFNEMSKSEREKRIHFAAEKLQIEKLMDKNVFNISGGEFQKCRLARCIVQESGILLFDEPSENLDLPYQNKFLGMIKNAYQEKTVLMSIHDINMAAIFADNFILLSDGNVISGIREKIFDAALLGKAYGARVRVFYHPELKVPQVLFE